jgi:hypothetical protein
MFKPQLNFLGFSLLHSKMAILRTSIPVLKTLLKIKDAVKANFSSVSPLILKCYKVTNIMNSDLRQQTIYITFK